MIRARTAARLEAEATDLEELAERIETGSATWRDYDMSLEHEPDRTEKAKDLARVEAADKRAAAGVIELVESMRKRTG
jgi:hypothetical protein